MERIEHNEDIIELGDATVVTRGSLVVGQPDSDQVLNRIGAGITDED
ncbi:benenodin family lasso peptide [Novosphingobium sp. P6W]|nr:benenodin family lasso peptide [Novosphingobium sp. P6W]AXB76573.1 hypothetical protein TQ38_008735 [Novosphingobium sp. P6W]